MAFWPNINILVYPHVPYTNMLMLSSFRKREIRNLIEQIIVKTRTEMVTKRYINFVVSQLNKCRSRYQ